MKKSIFIYSVTIIVILTGTAFVVKNSTGFTGATGAPSEGTCAGCHGGGTSIASGMTITSTPSFTGNVYEPGQTYTISVTVGASGFNNFGFGCTILNSSNANAGTLQNPGSGVSIANGPFGRKNAIHNSIKTGSGFATFSFEWIAPPIGAATIYASGNAVNLNGSTNGDLPLNTSLVLAAPIDAGLNEDKIKISNLSVFPNPVKDKLSIHYQLNNADNITIQLLTIKGEMVANLLDEKQEAGLHQKSFVMPTGIAPGVYFLKINDSKNNVKQKLLTVY